MRLNAVAAARAASSCESSVQIATQGLLRQANGAGMLQSDGLAQFAEGEFKAANLRLQRGHFGAQVAPILPTIPFERLPYDSVPFERVGERLRHEFANIFFEAGVTFAFLCRLGPASAFRIKVGVISASFRSPAPASLARLSCFRGGVRLASSDPALPNGCFAAAGDRELRR
jgi:hypothetical protein